MAGEKTAGQIAVADVEDVTMLPFSAIRLTTR
jgi:hypothetical protein